MGPSTLFNKAFPNLFGDLLRLCWPSLSGLCLSLLVVTSGVFRAEYEPDSSVIPRVMPGSVYTFPGRNSSSSELESLVPRMNRAAADTSSAGPSWLQLKFVLESSLLPANSDADLVNSSRKSMIHVLELGFSFRPVAEDEHGFKAELTIERASQVSFVRPAELQGRVSLEMQSFFKPKIGTANYVGTRCCAVGALAQWANLDGPPLSLGSLPPALLSISRLAGTTLEVSLLPNGKFRSVRAPEDGLFGVEIDWLRKTQLGKLLLQSSHRCLSRKDLRFIALSSLIPPDLRFIEGPARARNASGLPEVYCISAEWSASPAELQHLFHGFPSGTPDGLQPTVGRAQCCIFQGQR